MRFQVKEDGGAPVEIVQSLAKWKRLALARYGFQVGEGLYTDMNAIRPDETIDNTHSIYVDQWDWEKILTPEQRNLQTLKDTVEAIYDAISRTEFHIASRHSNIRPVLPAHYVHHGRRVVHPPPATSPAAAGGADLRGAQSRVRDRHWRSTAGRPAARRPRTRL